MSIETNITGHISIRKEKNISIKKILNELCKDNALDLKSEDQGPYYSIIFHANIKIEIETLIPYLEKNLRPHLEEGSQIEISGLLTT